MLFLAEYFPWHAFHDAFSTIPNLRESYRAATVRERWRYVAEPVWLRLCRLGIGPKVVASLFDGVLIPAGRNHRCQYRQNQAQWRVQARVPIGEGRSMHRLEESKCLQIPYSAK